jgi:hypothetical protein
MTYNLTPPDSYLNKWTIKTQPGVSPSGVEMLVYKLNRYNEVNDLESYYWQNFKDNWWFWNTDYVSKKADLGTFRGKLTTRIQRYYWKRSHHKVDDKFMSEIGNIAAEHRTDGTEYTLYETETYDWKRGKFGYHEASSCFWSERRNAKYAMRQYGIHTLQIYRTGEAFARAWFVPADNPHNPYDGPMIFNAYAVDSDFRLKKIGVLLEGLWGLPQHGISFTIDGTAEGLIWINNSKAVALHPTKPTECDFPRKMINDYVAWNDLWQDTDYGVFLQEDLRVCDRCGEWAPVDRTVTRNWNTYCDDCDAELLGII